MIDAIKRLRNRDGSQRAQIHAALQRREVNPAEQISKRVPIVLKAGQRRGIARGPFPPWPATAVRRRPAASPCRRTNGGQKGGTALHRISASQSATARGA